MAEAEAKREETKEQLAGGTYEIIRNRLNNHAEALRGRLDALNQARKEVFGSIESALIAQERVTTDNNCVPRDMVCIGEQFLFGYNVHLGLKSEFKVGDVFSVYSYADHAFTKTELTLIKDKQFQEDFRNLYHYYKATSFSQFARIGTSLFMVFRVGKDTDAIKTFKWVVNEDHTLTYVDNRSDHEYRFPPQHEFEWRRATRDQHRGGEFPHVSIDDRIFVETTGGDLTVKVEDNTETGAGIYAEPVDDPDQTLDDAEFHYAVLGNLILLKIKPYREEAYRYIVYNEKVQEARRIDTIKDACVLLPEDHGIIFSNGYYLQNGEFKLFESELSDMHFRKRISSPNGEDTLFVFFNRESGTYMLLAYNMIEQTVATPTVCNGYSTFENGEMIYFKSDGEPKKHHPIQIWQTPFVSANYEAPQKSDSFLYKLGNRDIVRAMAACRAVLNLVGKEESYANVYVDISREANDILDAYFWLDKEEAENLREPLEGIRRAAGNAIEEFEKVVRLRKDTAEQVGAASAEIKEILSGIATRRFADIGDFVELLARLRTVRGRTIGLKELRYVDLEEVAALEKVVEENTASLANRCVAFLLSDEALAPYEQKVVKLKAAIEPVKTVKDAKSLESEIVTSGGELEMLIEIVSNLKIEDARDRTKIIDGISEIYATLNQARSTLSNRIKFLASAEGEAEFGSQIKLLDQAVINYLDVCDTPEKCDEYLTKITVQVGELEGRFSDFDQFIIELTEKRDEIYNAFESRKLSLVEARNKKTDAYLRSAERILSGINTRVQQLTTVEEINGYFASDLMVDKVRDIIEQLRELDDIVKADDIQSRLKTLMQDTLRQLRDRNELFVAGENVIKFGEHHFSVNTQDLALTIVDREDGLYLHLTGTNFFERIDDPRIEETRPVWDQQLVSENEEVYRGEVLAYAMLKALRGDPKAFEDAASLNEESLVPEVREFMAPLYAEGYVKGVHDVDAAKYLAVLLRMEATIGLLRFHPRARALAMLYWHQLGQTGKERRAALGSKLRGVGEINTIFQSRRQRAQYLPELQTELENFTREAGLFDIIYCAPAAEYLFDVLTNEERFAISGEAHRIYRGLMDHLDRRGATKALQEPLDQLGDRFADALVLLKDWVSAFLESRHEEASDDYIEEVAVLFINGLFDSQLVVSAEVEQEIVGLVGDHPVLVEGKVTLNYNRFTMKLTRFEMETVPLFEAHQRLKKEIVEEATDALRLEEFRPRILSSFVRNRLIDKVYLPLVGDNLAKQIGVVGAETRTDRMGLLLLISPPGYGKTTLMEYIANRLGVIFMKINGPAIGHKVTSLDPGEAPNAAAREEMKKLSLSFEMGDNVMIYLDDIQHCNPEFLQKFISLCDAQRKIEGVYKGRTRTYDFRGRRVCVVMAGNPYSESGEAFKIPDMLANRADTYNLGDIIGESDEAFKLSYLENALTSSPVLGKMAAKNFKDVYGIIRAAASGSREGIDFEGNYSGPEIEEYISVMKKLLKVRDVILKVNQQYIYSAAQADEYRTEPPFKLQGSYRNMNRITEKVLPIMNDEELVNLVNDHYASESQTLTTASEANLLKFKALTDALTGPEADRWNEIRSTFNRNQLLGDDSDPMRQVIAVLSTFREGLGAIQGTLESGIEQMANSQPIVIETSRAVSLDTSEEESTGMFQAPERTIPAAERTVPVSKRTVPAEETVRVSNTDPPPEDKPPQAQKSASPSSKKALRSSVKSRAPSDQKTSSPAPKKGASTSAAARRIINIHDEEE